MTRFLVCGPPGREGSRTRSGVAKAKLIGSLRRWLAAAGRAILDDFDRAAAAAARHDLERAARLIARIERDLSALEDAAP
jgi:hypothetical protein